MLPKNKLLVATHHKAGTGFNNKVFRAISKEFGLKFWPAFHEPYQDGCDWDIGFHPHSKIAQITKKYPQISGIHCIRHPKSLIYSAALYHQKCREPWVDVPLDYFSKEVFECITDGKQYLTIGDSKVSLEQKTALLNNSVCNIEKQIKMNGLTYREQLNQLSSIEEQVLFEMRAFSKGVIEDMLSFPKGARFYTVQLESISFDCALKSLFEAFTHLGFSGKELIRCLDIATDQCLWNIGVESIRGKATTGVSNEWQKVFQGEVEDEYQKLFGNAAEKLGYDY